MKAQLLHNFATALAALGMAWPAIAADMPLKGPLLPPAGSGLGWGGYYFGGNIGYSLGKENLDLSGFTEWALGPSPLDPSVPRTSGASYRQ